MESVLDKAVNLKLVKKWTLEPAMFLLFFGWWLSHSILPNQILRQTCLYTFGYDQSVCTHLDDKNTTHSVEEEIQPYVANILMTTQILNSIVPTVLCLFLGPWSDKYGRKKVINCIFAGTMTSIIWMAAVSYTSESFAISPWNYLFAQLPYMMFGGLPTIIITILCYLTDQTNETNRSIRNHHLLQCFDRRRFQQFCA
jgi:MFS family permease